MAEDSSGKWNYKLVSVICGIKKAAGFLLPPSLFIVKGVHNEKKTVSCYFILRAALTHLRINSPLASV